MRRKLDSIVIVPTLVAGFIAITILSILVSLLVKLLPFEGIEYSSGQRTGRVFKISEKGVIWKTYEGELSLGIATRDSEGALVNQIFNFSVTDKEVVDQIKAAAKSGRETTLNYKQYLLRGFRYGETGYTVISVE